jgi:hypothetical protein
MLMFGCCCCNNLPPPLTPILPLRNKQRATQHTLLVLDLLLDLVDRVRRLHLKGDGLASQCLDKDLHAGDVEGGEKRKERAQELTKA